MTKKRRATEEAKPRKRERQIDRRTENPEESKKKIGKTSVLERAGDEGAMGWGVSRCECTSCICR